MGSTEVDIKPTISADDISDGGLHTVPGVCKLKHSRYEDVWPEDVHAAFMEAVALYPPMGKRRLKYYRVSTHENEHPSNVNRAKSFGRCQLIQSYILEKTGKNRSRKQVSSHLQRLKKIHKDNPAMQPLFSECSQPSPAEHHCSVPQVILSSQDLFTNDSASTCHLKSDPDLAANTQDMDGANGSSTFSSDASSFNGGPCNSLNLSADFYDDPPFPPPRELLSPVPQQRPAGALHLSDNDYLSWNLQDALLFKDAVNGGLRSGSAFNAPVSSTSTRHLASKPMQGRLVDSGPTMHFSRAVHSLGFQPTHQWVSHEGWMEGVSCNSPLTSGQEAFHTSLVPLQFIPSEKQRLYPGLASEWMWPKYPDLPLDPREDYFTELRRRYPPAMYQYNSTTPGFYSSSSPSESEVLQLPRSFSYSYAITSPATASESENIIDILGPSPESSENLASPFVIRPTPLYPISYIHTNIHVDSCTPAAGLPP